MMKQFGWIRKPLLFSWTSWKKILIICTCFSLYIILSMPDYWISLNKYFCPVIKFEVLTQGEIDELSKEFFLSSKLIINTTGCKIPRTPILPTYYKDKWHGEINPICNYESILSDLSDEIMILTLRPNYANYECCLSEITRVENMDNNFVISPCEEFSPQTPLNVNQKEILLTKCGNFMNFEANFVIRRPVQEKINYWSKIPPEKHPPSVMLIGVDTMSRSHAFRSLPKTMALMKSMGFADFHGYHSIEPATRPNFFGFLMGLTFEQVKGAYGCSPNETTPFDNCPFIWKDFSLHNYVTMYVEDGSQTFNFHGQSGFSHRPTDFYIHAIFKAIKELRVKYSPISGDEDRIDCTSNETVPQFVARYTERFIKKFQDVPTFSFSWFEDPFHENPFTLSQLDKELLKIYQFIYSSEDLLENTVLVFLSDHGDRFSSFMGTTEAYIERALPPLMIRFPKSLRAKFPNLDQTLKTNTKSLTGPFDVHQTLKHILSMNSKTTANFESVLPDRSSLFYPVSSNRTCKQIHVVTATCICGMSLDPSPITNQFYLEKILEFVEFKLNEEILNSKYATLCHEWTTTVDKIQFTRVIEVTDKYSDTLIQFETLPGNAKFEIKIRVLHSKTKYDGCKLMGEFVRISAYGTQSYCVGAETAEDKKMKELCMCK